jgi:hypothetical protein
VVLGAGAKPAPEQAQQKPTTTESQHSADTPTA